MKNFSLVFAQGIFKINGFRGFFRKINKKPPDGSNNGIDESRIML